MYNFWGKPPPPLWLQLLHVMVTGPCRHMSDYLYALLGTAVNYAVDYQYQVWQLMNAKMRKNRLDETFYIVVWQYHSAPPGCFFGMFCSITQEVLPYTGCKAALNLVFLILWRRVTSPFFLRLITAWFPVKRWNHCLYSIFPDHEIPFLVSGKFLAYGAGCRAKHIPHQI